MEDYRVALLVVCLDMFGSSRATWTITGSRLLLVYLKFRGAWRMHVVAAALLLVACLFVWLALGTLALNLFGLDCSVHTSDLRGSSAC